MNKICPAGYADPTTKELVESLMTNEHESWIVVDIRKSAFAARWFASWGGKELAMKYAGRYIHIPELGNINYKPEDRHKGIKIADPQIGLEYIRREFRMGHNLILLCACKNYDTCHRKVVVELIKERFPDVKVA